MGRPKESEREGGPARRSWSRASSATGLQERLTQRLFPLVAPLLPNRYHQIRVEDLARAMRVNAGRLGPDPYVVSGFSRTVSPDIEVLEYPDFMRLLRDS
jgi:hypothetical protein